MVNLETPHINILTKMDLIQNKVRNEGTDSFFAINDNSRSPKQRMEGLGSDFPPEHQPERGGDLGSEHPVVYPVTSGASWNPHHPGSKC